MHHAPDLHLPGGDSAILGGEAFAGTYARDYVTVRIVPRRSSSRSVENRRGKGGGRGGGFGDFHLDFRLLRPGFGRNSAAAARIYRERKYFRDATRGY